MKKLVSILIIFLFLAGCDNQSKTAEPSVLLSENQMIDVMVDVQIMESAISHKKSKNWQTLYLRTRGFDTIFSHYGITDSIFIENFNYYSDDPEVMLRLMDSVVARIARFE